MALKLIHFLIITSLSLLLPRYSFAQAEFTDGYDAAQSGNYQKAVQIWQSLAEGGDISAQYSLGWMYESGQGVQQDNKKAAEWYKKSALQGSEAAQYVLATMFEKGSGVKQNNKQALRFFILAAQQGDATSQFQVAYYYQSGRGVNKNITKSIFWYQKAAKQGHVNAKINLGSLFQLGQDVEKNDTTAIKWYISAANQGSALAQYQLASLYEQGLGEKQNYPKAIQLYIQSANADYSPSAYRLGIIFERGLGVDVDFKQASRWYHRAALQGNGDAQFHLGHLSQFGNGTDKNVQRAIEWYTQAAGNDHARAYYQLAEIYENGTTQYSLNISQNLHKAFQYYQHASQLNFSLAHAKLAYFLEKGIANDVDQQQAIRLYQQAPQSWAKIRLNKLVKYQHCLKTATTTLFSELISCANRETLRKDIKQQSIKIISEDDLAWSDTYFIGAIVQGASELNISYTRNDLFVKAHYTFVGRNDPQLIDKIKNKIILRYGQPNSHGGGITKSENSFQWVLHDAIILKVYQLLPDTTTFVDYIQQDNLALQIIQQQQSMNKLFQSVEQLKHKTPSSKFDPIF